MFLITIFSGFRRYLTQANFFVYGKEFIERVFLASKHVKRTMRISRMFPYSGCRGHILHTALLVGALSSRQSVLAAAITDTQNKKGAGTDNKTLCAESLCQK